MPCQQKIHVKTFVRKGGDDQKNNNVFLQISIDSLTPSYTTVRYYVTCMQLNRYFFHCLRW